MPPRMSNTSEFMQARFRKAEGRAGCSLADLGAQPEPFHQHTMHWCLSLRTIGVGREAARQLVEAEPDTCAEGKAELRRQYEQQFPGWLCSLQEGHSLCFHGYGSKAALLAAFVDSQLRPYDEDCMTVYGMRSGVTARTLLVNAAAFPALGSIPAKLRSSSDMELLQMIAQRGAPLFIVLNNIEGPGLRTPAAQALLSRIAACDAVSLLASYDHVNTPVLWDQQVKHRFNWQHHHVPTFEPYWRELDDGNVPPLLLSTRGGQSNEVAAVTVLLSLTPKAREVFRTIVQNQQVDDGAGGVEFLDLFKQCNRKFLLGQRQGILKNHLQEFRDHSLVDTKRAENGAELWYVPLPDDLLEVVLREIEG